MHRYQGEIRADLMEVYGVDLADWWRSRRWRALLELIDQLPAASRFNEAVLSDPDYADLVVKAEREREQEKADDEEGEGESWTPRISEYDLHAILLRDIVLGLHSVQSAVIAGAGGKPPRPLKYPVPKTAIDDARERELHAWANSLIARIAPHAVR